MNLNGVLTHWYFGEGPLCIHAYLFNPSLENIKKTNRYKIKMMDLTTKLWYSSDSLPEYHKRIPNPGSMFHLYFIEQEGEYLIFERRKELEII